MTRFFIIPSSIVRWLAFPHRLEFASTALRVLRFAIPLLLLTACDSGRHERMQEELLHAREMNKEYVDFTTDSVMKEVTAYYDRNGTPNERMEAHYLLSTTSESCLTPSKPITRPQLVPTPPLRTATITHCAVCMPRWQRFSIVTTSHEQP